MGFWRALGAYGDSVALIGDDDRRWTYRELIEAADAAIPPGHQRHCAVLAMANRPDSIIAYLAALRAGWPVILLNDGDATAAKRMIEQFRPGRRWEPGAGFVATDVCVPVVDLHPDLAVLLSTSGTTGSTKLVRLSADAIDANARSIAAYLELAPGERAITTLPPSYSYGLSVLNSHLAAGATLVLNEGSVIDPAFRRRIEETGATSLAGVPYTYELLERSGFFNAMPGTIRTLTQAGGRMPQERVERISARVRPAGARLFVMYGQTEATARMAYLPPDRLPERADCIGRAIPGGHFDLVDPESGAPAGSTGELVYSGPNVMMGYADAAADLVRGHDTRRLHTGDLAEEVEPGLYRIVGRRARFIKPFGLRVSLDEVEAQARAMGYTIVATGDDTRLVLAGEDAGASPVATALAARYGLPDASVMFHHYDALPRLVSGKIDYRTILSNSDRASETILHEGGAVMALFKRQFPNRTITPADTFLSLDGDSLSYVAISVGLEELIGATAGWENRTIADLGALAGAERPTRPPLFARIETGIVLRAIAPLTIVLFHYHFRIVAGGAAVLFVVSGHNFGRFSISDLLGGRTRRVLTSFLVNMLESVTR